MTTKYSFEKNPGYEKLSEAFKRSNNDFLNVIELVPEKDIYFSSKLNKNMERLIKRQKHSYWKYFNTIGKRVAVIALTFLLLFGISMTVEAVRDPVINFIVNAFEKFSELFVDKSEIQNAPDKIEEVYCLTELPDGFFEIKQIKTDNVVETYWDNNGVSIVLRQSVLKSKITNDIEDTNLITFIKDQTEYRFLSKNNLTYLTWRNNRYIFEIIWHENVSIETISTISKSIKSNN